MTYQRLSSPYGTYITDEQYSFMFDIIHNICLKIDGISHFATRFIQRKYVWLSVKVAHTKYVAKEMR